MSVDNDLLNSTVVNISRIWNRSPFPKPEYVLAVYDGKYYVTTSDNESIAFFVKADGTDKYVYAGPREKCLPSWDKTNCVFYYAITDPGSIQIVSCSKPYREQDIFAMNEILKYTASTGLF